MRETKKKKTLAAPKTETSTKDNHDSLESSLPVALNVPEMPPVKDPKDEQDPYTVIVEGVSRKKLTSEDLLVLENLQLVFALNLSQTSESSLLAEKIETEASKKIHSLRVKIARLQDERAELLDKKRRSLNVLSQRYGVNFNSDSVAYDDVTGLITVVEEPWNRENEERKNPDEAGKQ
jgi:hypothetical protein